jgi:hypothetical protein
MYEHFKGATKKTVSVPARQRILTLIFWSFFQQFGFTWNQWLSRTRFGQASETPTAVRFSALLLFLSVCVTDSAVLSL